MRILILGFVLFSIVTPAANVCAAELPNILWITSEDNGPELGCYGDHYADTPNIDQLASRGLKYNYCWSNAPVCAPARTTIISGMYPPSLGAQHMRSQVPMPEQLKMYPEYLRQAGYYCTNNSKEDYNLDKPNDLWDDSSKKAHWKNRGADQPFFSIFNHTVSHESQLRKRPHTPVHDPAGVRVPDYHPDTPEVRQDWAQYYDKLTEMDQLVGKNIKELQEAGLMDETIIFYYGDHGSGMPRHKRWPYNSGLHVPLIVVIPEKFQHLAPPEYKLNGTSDRLVSFVDLAPTVLSLAGVEPPQEWQGYAFAGKYTAPEQDFIYGFRGRMDERPDFVRSVRNQRFIYIRHFQRQRPYGQFVHYMFRTPTTRKWFELHEQGKLTPAQDLFWQTKPVEELYDLQADRDEVNNLAEDPAHKETLQDFRQALFQFMIETKDLGIVPEAELHQRTAGKSPYNVQRNGDLLAQYDRVLLTAAAASHLDVDKIDQETMVNAFENEEATIRYWACEWALMYESPGVEKAHKQLINSLKDSSPSVRVAAAEALGRYGNEDDLKQALPVLLKAADLNESDVYTAIAALNSLDYLDDRAMSIRDEIDALPEKVKQMPPRMDSYVPRLKEKIMADLDGKPTP